MFLEFISIVHVAIMHFSLMEMKFQNISFRKDFKVKRQLTLKTIEFNIRAFSDNKIINDQSNYVYYRIKRTVERIASQLEFHTQSHVNSTTQY